MTDALRRPSSFDRRRVTLFLIITFGVAWLTALVISLTGGIRDSPVMFGPLTLAVVLMAGPMMFAPAIGNLGTRLLTDEGWTGLNLSPDRGAWSTYVLAWLSPAVLTLLGAGIYFAVFPGHFDPTMRTYADLVEGATGVRPDVATVAVLTLLSALTVGPVVNALFAVGEEFGWRGYLLPKLLPLGTRTGVLLQGVVWGIWHWPVIVMGYEYGFGYSGFPWAGMVVFPVFTVGAGTFLAWVTVREGSVWPAAIGHGAMNAIAGFPLLLASGQPNPLLGPLPVGLVGASPWLVLAAYLLWDQQRLTPG